MTGLTNAGKSSISSPTSKKYNIPTLETGTFVYKELEERGLDVTPDNIKSVSLEVKGKSDSYFTEKLIAFAKQEYSDAKVLFVSGVRAVSEVEYLKKEFGRENVLVVGFHASQGTRFSRLSNPDRINQEGAKGKEDQALRDYDNFIAREMKELGFGVGAVFAMADNIISNDDKKYPFHSVRHNIFVFETIVYSFMNS